MMKRCSFISLSSSLTSSTTLPLFASLAPTEASASTSTPQLGITFHLSSIHSQVRRLSGKETNTIDHIGYIRDFSSLIRNLSINTRNYGALRSLDSLLTKTHFLDSATSVLVIEGLCRLNKLTRAKTVLSNLKKKGIVSDYFLYNLVIHCLVKEGSKINDVENVWNEVSGSEFSSLGRRIDASDFIIHVCKFGKVLEIESMGKRVLMSDGVVRHQSYISLIGVLCRENKVLLATEVLRKMKNKGFKADNITYFIMFQCLCRNGYLEEADLVLRKLIKRKYSVDICVFGNFIYGLCKLGKLKEADKLFRKLIKRDSSRVSGILQLKDRRRAISQLDCRGLVPEIMAYEAYVKSLCSVGRLEEAENFLKEMLMKRTVVEVCVYKSFIRALFRAGRSADAIKFFNVQRIKGLVPEEEIAKSVILGLCEMGEVDDAWKIFSEVNMKVGFVSVTSLCNCILGSYLKLERFEKAVTLFEKMQEGSFGGPNISTYLVMVNGFYDQGKFSMAFSIFEEMLNNNVPPNGDLYEVIIRGFCESRRLEEAHRYLNKMIENGQLVSYVRWKLIFDSMFVGSGDCLSLGF